jgi:hypothetical protein
LFVELLKRLMHRRKKPLYLVLDSLPAHKKAVVKEYVASTEGRLTLHFLPGHVPNSILTNGSGVMPSERASPENP